MGYILCGHGGSGDHGQEDRIRGTCRLLPSRPELLTPCIQEDWHYGLAEVADLTAKSAAVAQEGLYLTAAPGLLPGCAAQLLWCWQGQPIQPQQVQHFRAITVPNRSLLQQLWSQGIGNRLRLGPDPNFLVARKLRPVKDAFRRDTVGLCFSAGLQRFEPAPGLLFESYCRLMCHLLITTDYDLALIPYCARPHRSDFGLLDTLYRRFAASGRVHLRSDASSEALRGDLSLCRMVVGSAGAVAAWSCGVPALCIGADPYALGLARELFGQWQDTLLPVGWITGDGDLIRAFRTFHRREDTLRRLLENGVVRHRQRAMSWDWEKLRLMA